MSLTDDERRSLDEIDRALGFSDRNLDRTMTTGRFRNRQMHLGGVCLVVAGFGALVAGVVLAQQQVEVFAWAVATAGQLLRIFSE